MGRFGEGSSVEGEAGARGGGEADAGRGCGGVGDRPDDRSEPSDDLPADGERGLAVGLGGENAGRAEVAEAAESSPDVKGVERRAAKRDCLASAGNREA